MILLKPVVELLVSSEEAFQGFANDIFVSCTSKESRITLKHCVRFLVETAETTFFSCLGSTFGIRAMFCSPVADVIKNS
jgi:hypothetical protein